METQLFTKLKTKYSHFGLGDEILKTHAKMLVASGFVTSENIDNIVDMQNDYLSGLQKLNDKRVTDALAQLKVTTDEDKAKAIEKLKEELLKAHGTEKEELLKQIEELKRKKEDPEEKDEKDEKGNEMKAYIDTLLGKMNETAKIKQEELNKRIEDILAISKKQSDELKALVQENETMKREKATQERNVFITDTAKKLQIPEWRINEGFVITDAMENAEIETYLGTIANNLKVAALQGSRMGGVVTVDGEKATKEEVLDILKGF